MNNSAQVQSPEMKACADGANSSPENEQYDLGPDLKPPGWLNRRLSILNHIQKRQSIQIAIIAVVMLLLYIGVKDWDVLRLPTPLFSINATPSERTTNLADWLNRMQSFFSLGTLIIALLVWYYEIYNDWEESLPKRMSVFFFHKDQPAIICRYVWLAGADDLRAWGQQVASQTAKSQTTNNEKLSFSPDINAHDPELVVWTDNKICRHYAVHFQLTELPNSLVMSPGICRYQNMAAYDKQVRSVPQSKVEVILKQSMAKRNWYHILKDRIQS